MLKVPYLVVASCKGGVGKSTLAASIAHFLSYKYSLNVGLIDTDIWGASQHMLFSIKSLHNEYHSPLQTESGVHIVGMGITIDNASLMWRAPIALKMLKHFLHGIKWPNIDIIVVDTPPGTSDVMITLSRELQDEQVKAILVQTPQDMVSNIAHKTSKLLEKFNIPIAHTVINMSYTECRKCGHRMHSQQGIFESDSSHTYIPLDTRVMHSESVFEVLEPQVDHIIQSIMQ